MLVENSQHQYLYSITNEEQRNVLQHTVLQPSIQPILTEMLENYGLRQHLEAALKTGSQVQIMEAGSGSGSFLRDFADFLQEKGLSQVASLTGLDLNMSYIASAEQQNSLKPTWSNINYYQHDVTLPLESNYSLQLEKKLEFDCICATLLIQYLPNARQHILNLYNCLKPGGILYLCDSYMSYEGKYPWIAPNSTIEEFGRIATGLVRNFNNGKIVAEESAYWLQEAGAEQIQQVVTLVKTGGDNPHNLEILRYYIAIVRSVTPVLLKLDLIDQAKHDEFLAGVLQIERHSFVQLPFIHTLARRPAAL